MFKCVFHNLVYQFIFLDVFLKKLNTKTSSSSFPLAVPVIWGRRYGC